MCAQFHETVRGRDFYDRDIPNLIQAIKQVAHELQQNTEMQYKHSVKCELTSYMGFNIISLHVLSRFF